MEAENVYDEALDFANELFDLVHITNPMVSADYWYERSFDLTNDESDRMWCIAMCEALGGVSIGWNAKIEESYVRYEQMVARFDEPPSPHYVQFNQSQPLFYLSAIQVDQ